MEKIAEKYYTNLFGRQVIYTNYAEINESNLAGILYKALQVHCKNREEIQYLYNYYKGYQPILARTKEVRAEINNKVVVNRANEIVSFKVGYLMGEPVQYVSRSKNDKEVAEHIITLNKYVYAEDKDSEDEALAEWFYICGTAYRMVLPDDSDDIDESPFEIFTLDPRSSFVVYHSGLGNKPLMGVKEIVLEDESVVYCVYTRNMYYEVKDGQIIKKEPHALGDIPIVEYAANTARLGAFEIVIPLLDAINLTASNRMDGIEQFIQALLVLKGAELSDEAFKNIKEIGGIKLPKDSDISYLVQELNQTNTQTLVDDMYDTVLTICGMPNRNGGSSTSDTGAAVIMRDGWSAAEARAKDTEKLFKKSEKKFLKVALRIANILRNIPLKLSDIEPRFTRRNYENIQIKAQVLTTMLACDQIHPRLAFAHCGMFVDPELAYTQSVEYAKEKKIQAQKELEQFTQNQVNLQKNKINAENQDEE